jgi:tetratricopeptide (TPR) repeat protein
MSKEELREDKVVAAITDAGEYFKRNAIAIGTVVAVLLAALIVVLVIRQGRERAEQQAAVILLAGEALYNTGGAGEALPRFLEAAERYGGSRSGKIASLRVADCHLEAGKAFEATTWYERYLDTGPKDGLLRASGLRGWGAALDAMGEKEQAAQRFLEAAEIKENPLRGDDLLSAGLAWLDAGNHNQAISAFEKLMQAYPDHPRLREAREGLAFARARAGT